MWDEPSQTIKRARLSRALQDEAIRRFRHFMELYGELPWVDQEPIGEFLDDHFPAYTTDL
jgi:hypothetical protein